MSLWNSKAIGLATAMSALYLGAAAAPAHAHISLERGGTHKSRYGAGEQKQGQCGRLNGKRGTNIYTYEPGETITVKVAEVIPHPSYYRVAFDNDGDDDFLFPRSIKPIEATRRCPFNRDDQCGKSDFYNNETVLPGLDNIYPHVSRDAKTLTIQVKLPDVECDNCTLQVIQVMQDTVHGAYNTTPENPDNSLEDVYTQCIDLVLKRKPGSRPPAARVDASTPTTAADAGVKVDASLFTVEDESNPAEALASIHDHESDEPQSSESGCSLGGAGSAHTAGWLLLALGTLARRGRKRQG